MRADVLNGRPHPEGMAALRFHGLWQGLAILLQPAAQPLALSPSVHSAKPLSCESELVRLLANIVLRTHSELAHVY